ncbi:MULTISPECIES: TrbC/VirB2 family protein [Burkholderia]|uniref:Type VI secretion protein n=1 Tax=Burkholderia ubonensis TaxID=101571 RepID=A0A1B4LI98_9BURK|nr:MULTISPECIES: TrbC/VirB2 family protein [Burkholderia cepacia complex]AJY08917.1 trbC/VIRB2 family protein [Burkholderia vietnamiensis LMG 10929]AOJ76848.1 type VI secretion protein [Burkholderia ubonensis]AOK02433.1 type VI secretion protein [Burkholderia vietnamiensis]AOK13945.1 type VI secretion protein [Burkholderia vietnamiensis]AVR14572.1 type VI secretion protein [Burkholderia vietnamiensis]
MHLGMRYKSSMRAKRMMRFLSDRKTALEIILGASSLMFTAPARAQLSQVNTLLDTIQATLLSVGGVICSISIIWAGFRMMFQHARFGDIANVFIGGLFVGCATVIAGMLIPSS